MTGGEAILKRIRDDAEAAAQSTQAKAEEQAAAIARTAEEQAAASRQAIVAEGERQAEAIRRAAQSSAALLTRNALLEERRRLIDETLAATLRHLQELPDDVYFTRLLELIGRSAHAGEGVLRLNARDLGRLPADFTARLQAAVPDGSIQLAQEPCGVEGGFLLQYGDIVYNCGFAALLEARRDEIEDTINAALFA